MGTYEWQEDGRMLIDQRGSWLGDAQVGKEYSRRYWRQHDDATYTVITDIVGVESYDAGAGRSEYAVVNLIETLRCRDRSDPGGTEIQSDYTRNNAVNYLAITNLRQAGREARAYALRFGPEIWDHYAGEGIDA